MTRLREGGARDRRPTKVSHGRWNTMTFLGDCAVIESMRRWFVERPIDRDSFRASVARPSLRPGDNVVIDSLGSDRSKVVRQLIRLAGAKLFFLPKYSSDLNPIEQVFASSNIRSERLSMRSAIFLTHFTSEECTNYLKNSKD